MEFEAEFAFEAEAACVAVAVGWLDLMFLETRTLAVETVLGWLTEVLVRAVVFFILVLLQCSRWEMGMVSVREPTCSAGETCQV